MEGVLSLAVAPGEEPVSVAEAKAHLRVSINDDDDLIASYIQASREDVEDTYTWRSFVDRTYDYYLQAWPRKPFIRLPRPPLVSVTSVTYTDSDGTVHTLSADAYHVDAVSKPGQVVLKSGESWPTDALQTSNAIAVRYVAGYGAAAAVPEWAKWAIKILAAHKYENREAVTIAAGVVATELPRFFTDGLRGRRIY